MLYPLSYGGHGHQCAAFGSSSAGIIRFHLTVVTDGVSSTA